MQNDELEKVLKETKITHDEYVCAITEIGRQMGISISDWFFDRYIKTGGLVLDNEITKELIK